MNYHINVWNIDYDITDEDLDGVWDSIERLKETLPDHLEFDLAIGDDEDDDEVICDHITDLTGWLVNKFEYKKKKKNKRKLLIGGLKNGKRNAL